MRTNSFRRGAVLAAGFLLGATALVGCSGGAATGEVSGTVLVDGVPPMDGSSINFVPTSGPTAGATLVGGKYTVTVATGSAKVQIFAMRKLVGASKPKAPKREGPGADDGGDYEMSLGEEFNEKTTLTLDVKAGAQEKNWDLKSKK